MKQVFLNVTLFGFILKDIEVQNKYGESILEMNTYPMAAMVDHNIVIQIPQRIWECNN